MSRIRSSRQAGPPTDIESPVAASVADAVVGVTAGEVATDESSTRGPTTANDAGIQLSDEAQGYEAPARASHTGKLLVFGVVPLLALAIGASASYLKWQQGSLSAGKDAATESVQVATDVTIKMLSYRPDSVERDLGAARDFLTGSFRDSYTGLINDVVIQGSKEQQISAVATVPAASSVSATADHAVVLVFVNQTTIVGSDAPSDTASSVKVTLDKLNGRWLISGFEPV